MCTLELGRATNTGDAVGMTIATADVPPDLGERFAAIARAFTGPIAQIPPMYSAVQIDGERLYDLARAGKTVERAARNVTIYALTLLGCEERTLRLRIACSEGTYIRTLCEDLATALGTVGHMGALLREASGPFVLYEAKLLEDIIADPGGALVPPEHVIPIPTIVLDGRDATDFRAGRTVALAVAPAEKHVFVRDQARLLVGVGETVGTLLSPRKVFV